VSLRESVSMTYRQLEDELEKMYPGLNRGEASKKLAEEMGGYSHRTIAAYVYGHRRIVPQFIARFVEFYALKHGREGSELLQKLAVVETKSGSKRVVLAESKMLTRLQRAVDTMCLNCAGSTVEEGGFCWDGGCPLAEFTRYPAKPGA
jgi:hypothetical protein